MLSEVTMIKDKFKQIDPNELENAIKLIGSDWMLITAKDGEKVNAMTASWGALGVLWNKNVCICFIRPQRHTYLLTEKEERFSFAFLGDGYRDALRLCGTKSGRDCDKLALAGLTSDELDGVPVICESEILLVCKKIYCDDLKESCFLDESLLSNYKLKDYHRFYVCEIEKAYKKI